MAQTYPKTFKNCSTCNSWEGIRRVDASGSKIMVNSLNAKGKCKHQLDQMKLAFMTCKEWSEVGN